MWIDKGQSWFEMVHVKNVAEAIYLSIKNRPNTKEIYCVTDDNPQTARSFLTKLIETQGVKVPNKNIHKGIAFVLANIVEGIWKILKLKSTPPITRFDIAFVAMPRKYNISKIKNELNYKPFITKNEGLKELQKRFGNY